MTKDNLKIELPEGVPGQYQVHNVLHSSDSDRPSVLILIHDLSVVTEGYIVRRYTSRQENEEVIFDHELEAFGLPPYESAVGSYTSSLKKVGPIRFATNGKEAVTTGTFSCQQYSIIRRCLQMNLTIKVQEYMINGKTLNNILSDEYARYAQTWLTKGDTVLFWNGGSPLGETEPKAFRQSILYKWKVVDDKITAINYEAMRLTPDLAEVYFRYTYNL